MLESNRPSRISRGYRPSGEMTTTIVTGLWDIGRGSLPSTNNRNRPFSNYIEWFNILQELDCPIILFTSEAVKKQLKLREKDLAVVPCELKDLKYYPRREEWVKLIKNNPKLPPNLEYTVPEYNIIINSKIDLVLRAAQMVQTDYYFWLDAGIFRPKETGLKTAPKGIWPDPHKVKILADNRLLMPWDSAKPLGTAVPLSELDQLLKSQLSSGSREVTALLMAGTIHAFKAAEQSSEHLLTRSMQMGLIGTEEHILSAAAKLYPERFLPYPITRPKTRLSVYQLGSEMVMTLPSPTCPSVRVLTCTSREVKVPSFFRDSAARLGYKIEYLGASEKWGGWKWRIITYLKALQAVSLKGKEREPEVTILCDCTDVFFAGSAWEVYDKFKQDDRDVVIGGEGNFSYMASKKKANKVFFDERAPVGCEMSRYPNGGFVIGTTEALISLLTEIRDRLENDPQLRDDDQAAIIELLHEGYSLAIDYQAKYALSFPPQLYEYKKIKIQNGRLTYLGKEQPVLLHYPGKNFGRLQQHYNEINASIEINAAADPTTTSSSSWPWWVWALIAGGVVLLLIVVIVVIVLLAK